MEDVLNVAAHIAQRYYSEYHEQIDDMKLHNLMYFAQRESIIQTSEPLFDATFYGGQYGSVLKEIINITLVPTQLVSDCSPILDKVFKSYTSKDSWSLSRLVQGELSWKNSRLPENSDNLMSLNDIIADAERIKTRREKLSKLGLL